MTEQRENEMVQHGVDVAMQERSDHDGKPVSRARRAIKIGWMLFVVLYILASAVVQVYAVSQVRKTQACTKTQTAAARAVAADDRRVLDGVIDKALAGNLTVAERDQVRQDYFAARAENESVREQRQLTVSGVCQ